MALDPRRNSFFRASAGWVLVFCAAGFSTIGGDAMSAGGREPAELVLSGLPERGSTIYKELRRVAGKSEIVMLEMSGAEVWRLPKPRLKVFYQAVKKHGVTVFRVDTKSSAMLGSMAGGMTMSPRQSDMMQATKESSAVMGMHMMKAKPPALVEYALTKRMHEKGPSSQATIEIPLADGKAITAQRTNIVRTDQGYSWHGEVAETGEPVTLLWSRDGRMTGTLQHHGEFHVLKPMGGAMQAMVEMAPDKMPPEHAPAPKAMLEHMKMQEDPLIHQGDASMLREKGDQNRDEETAPAPSQQQQPEARNGGPVTITVMVAYSAAAARHYDDIRRDLIDLSIEQANQSFRQSGADNVRLKLVHAYETPYVESGTHFDHLWRFADRGDGYMEEVQRERDRVAADVAVLIVDDPNGCGLSTRVHADAEEAFAVLHHQCAATMYSLPHEIGHIIGARHDRALDTNSHPYAFGHGFVYGTRWRTMMSYKDTCDDCMRLPIWSSPNVFFRGVRAGNETTDNARVIRDGAARVANFRSTPTEHEEAVAERRRDSP